MKMPIISNRVRRIMEDDPAQTSDMPTMVAYGVLAEELQDALCQGARLLINCSLKTHPYNKDITCSACGRTFTRAMMATEVQPYHVEYLEGCKKPPSLLFAAAEDEASGEEDAFGEDTNPADLENGDDEPQNGAWEEDAT